MAGDGEEKTKDRNPSVKFQNDCVDNAAALPDYFPWEIKLNVFLLCRRLVDIVFFYCR